jgi:dGTPase
MVLRPAIESPGYQEVDRARFFDEPAKRPGRTEFARDRARIIHSWALRRLAAKTQVQVPWEREFPRTRLSHSLEVAQVGRELGFALGADPDVMESACLAHDIGHPPFGHNGEEILNELAAGCGGFEGNAQSFRLLVRLEAKTVDATARSVGLNLTRATLDAATKYPWPRQENSRKFGVYQDDLEIFEWMRRGAPAGKKSMEAQIMDWSDDISYSVHDLEDAIVGGQIKLKNIPIDLDLIYQVARNSFLGDVTEAEFALAYQNLSALSCWPSWSQDFDGSHVQLARLKDLTSQLIGRFALAAEQATRDRYGEESLTRYSADLIIPRAQQIEVGLLKAVSTHYVIDAESAQQKYADQQALLKDLVEHVYEHAPISLDSFFLADWQQAGDDAARLRVVIDQVASLTDPGAIALHSELAYRYDG